MRGFACAARWSKIDPVAAREALIVNAYGAFLVAQEAARRMIKRGDGAIFFTGASASVKGYRAIRRRSRWASSRCAGWRKAWHANCRRRACTWAHFVIDGGIRSRHAAGPRTTSPT